MTRRFLILAAATVTAATALTRTQVTDDALDPVRVAAGTHRVAFENPFVRVLEVHIPLERSSRDIAIRTG